MDPQEILAKLEEAIRRVAPIMSDDEYELVLYALEDARQYVKNQEGN